MNGQILKDKTLLQECCKNVINVSKYLEQVWKNFGNFQSSLSYEHYFSLPKVALPWRCLNNICIFHPKLTWVILYHKINFSVEAILKILKKSTCPPYSSVYLGNWRGCSGVILPLLIVSQNNGPTFLLYSTNILATSLFNPCELTFSPASVFLSPWRLYKNLSGRVRPTSSEITFEPLFSSWLEYYRSVKICRYMMWSISTFHVRSYSRSTERRRDSLPFL